jgi:hypothetical protein
LLTSGRIDAGLGVLRDVLAAVGMSLPATPFRALLPLLVGRARLWVRGIGFQNCPASSVSPADLRRIDVCWSAGTGLTVTDFIRGAYFQTRGLLLALRAGEPIRVARHLALDAVHAAVPGPGGDALSGRLIEAADSVAAGCADPYPRAMVTLARGTREYLAGRFRRAAELLRVAEQALRDSCTGVTWEIDTCWAWWLVSQEFMGQWAEMASELPLLLRDARDRGDLYADIYLSIVGLTGVCLAADEPDRALEEVEAAMGRWSQSGFHVQHHAELHARVIIHLHRNEGAGAWEYIRDKERRYRRALLWRVQQVRIDFLQMRTRSALAAADQAADRNSLLRSAERDVRKLERETAAWGQALGALMRACVHDARMGASGPELFAAAADRLEAADLGAFAAAARYRQGERTGGEEGARLRDAAVAWLAGQGVRDPLRIVCSHAPTVPPRTPGRTA